MYNNYFTLSSNKANGLCTYIDKRLTSMTLKEDINNEYNLITNIIHDNLHFFNINIYVPNDKRR